MATLDRAIEIAAKAHEGQFDKGGIPYICHSLRVMGRVPGEDMKIAAVLHDVVEDTSLTLDDLRAEGFSERVVEAVDSLTRRRGEDYSHFIMRAASNLIGINVKMADLFENCDLSRIPKPGPEDFERLRKYQGAIRTIRTLFIGANLPPQALSTPPKLSEGSEIFAEGGFRCSLCDQEAGHFYFIRNGDEFSYHRKSFTGGYIIPRAGEGATRYLTQLVKAGDIQGIFKADFELVPFYCPKCDACYCGDHYLSWRVFEDQEPFLHDFIRGRCPFGHVRMLED
ncbi:MAG: hypothetical protein ACOYJV_08500 [Aminivibrio sp.]